MEVLLHRIAWSFIFVLPLALFSGRLGEALRAMRVRRNAMTLLVSSCILACNWLLYIWAVNNDYVLEASLGYYMTPLFNVGMGRIFFKDQLSRRQWLAILLAFCGVAVQVVALGRFPVIALGLGLSFATYGLLRKIVPVESLPALLLETAMLFPFVLAALMAMHLSGQGVFGRGNWEQDFTLAFSGIITSIPLILFVQAARNLRLSSLGLLQYLSPTLTFLVGIFVLHETFTSGHLMSFGLIWAALLIYSLDSLNVHRRLTRN